MSLVPVPDTAVTIARLVDYHRQRQDLIRTGVGIGNRIEAVYRRFTGLKAEERARLHKKASNGEGQGTSDGLGQHADPEDDTANGGDHRSHVIQRLVVPADLATLTPQERLAARCKADPAFFAEREMLAMLRTTSMVAARDLVADACKPIEKQMEQLAQTLPVWPWVAGVRGFGAMGLAQIVAECGDLHNYANPAKVWKRMGLAVMPDGQRQRKVSGDAAIEHGYNPQRRSIMYVIGDSLMKGNRDGEYRTLYLARKEYEREKLPDAPAAHIDNRARRYLEKRLLRDLWRAWTATVALLPNSGMPDPPATALAAD